MPASALIRSARLAAGLSQAELAARSGASQPQISAIESGRRVPTTDTFERLLAHAGWRIVRIPLAAIDGVEVATEIEAGLLEGTDRPLRAFLDYSDSLDRAARRDRLAATLAEPPPTGDPAWDAALAGLVELRLNEVGLPAPEWTESDSRSLADPAAPFLGPYDLPPDVTDVPPEFAHRNVLIERSTLRSV